MTAVPDGGRVLTIFEAAVRYQSEGVPLVVIAGKGRVPGSSPRVLGPQRARRCSGSTP